MRIVKKLLLTLTVLFSLSACASSDIPHYFVGSYEQVSAAVAQVDSNCGFPNACTQTWAIPQQAYQQDFWFAIEPFINGYLTPCGSWTQEQMIAGVTNVQIEPSQSNWFPPVPPGN